MKENKNKLSRRSFLLGTGAGLAAAATSALVTEQASNGLWRRYARDIFRPQVWSREFTPQPQETYATLAELLDSEIPQQIIEKTLVGIDQGLQLYFDAKLDTAILEQIKRVCEVTNTDAGFPLIVTHYWSQHKIANAFLMQRENIVATLQAVLSSHADVASELSSKNSDTRWRVRKFIENIGSKRIPRWSDRGFTGTRTIGFSDRGVSVYSDVLRYFSEEKKTIAEVLEPEGAGTSVMTILYTLTDELHQKKEAAFADNNLEWQEGSEIASIAHQLEKVLLSHKESLSLGFGLEVLLRCYQAAVLNKTLQELKEHNVIDWAEPPHSTQQQVLLSICMLISCDAHNIYTVPEDHILTNRTDGDNIHPDWILGTAVEALFQKHPVLTATQQINGLTAEQVIQLVLDSSSDKVFRKNVYADTVRALFT